MEQHKLLIMIALNNYLVGDFDSTALTSAEHEDALELYVEKYVGMTVGELKRLPSSSEIITEADEKIKGILTDIVSDLKAELLGGK